MVACQHWTSSPFNHPEASFPNQAPWAWGCPWSRSFLDILFQSGFFVAYGAGVALDDQWHSKYARLAELTRMGKWENKCSLTEAEPCPAQPAPSYSEGQTGERQHWLARVSTYLALSLVPFAAEKKLYALEIPALLYSCMDLASQGHSLPWIRMRVWAVPSGHVCTLTFSVPYFPPSLRSMIHCFLWPFPLHPTDGLQSYLNFQALMRCGADQGSASLPYGLHKVTAGERKEAGRAFIRMYCFTFSIHHQGDDSILVKIHWTPIKSDGCYHWKLKSCQAIIGTNAGPRNGGLRASGGLVGIFLVILCI